MAPTIFFFLLETSTVNAFICELESTNHTPRNQLEFRVDLVHKLVENFNGRKDQRRPRIHPLEARFTERHFPEHVPYNEKGRPKERVHSLQSWWAGEVMFIYVPRLQCRTLCGPMF